MILNEISKTTGNPCSRPAGDMVRKKLAQRLIGPDAQIEIVPATLRGALQLPGPVTVIGEDLIAGQVTPEVAAGHILAAQAAAMRGIAAAGCAAPCRAARHVSVADQWPTARIVTGRVWRKAAGRAGAPPR